MAAPTSGGEAAAEAPTPQQRASPDDQPALQAVSALAVTLESSARTFGVATDSVAQAERTAAPCRLLEAAHPVLRVGTGGFDPFVWDEHSAGTIALLDQLCGPKHFGLDAAWLHPPQRLAARTVEAKRTRPRWTWGDDSGASAHGVATTTPPPRRSLDFEPPPEAPRPPPCRPAYLSAEAGGAPGVFGWWYEAHFGAEARAESARARVVAAEALEALEAPSSAPPAEVLLLAPRPCSGGAAAARRGGAAAAGSAALGSVSPAALAHAARDVAAAGAVARRLEALAEALCAPGAPHGAVRSRRRRPRAAALSPALI